VNIDDMMAIIETDLVEKKMQLDALAVVAKLLKYIPRKVLEEIVAVLEFGDTKHPGEEWRRISIWDHLVHVRGHLWAFEDEVMPIDSETHRHHLAHAICRLMFAAARELEDAKCNEEES
jgi:hypothetical protein